MHPHPRGIPPPERLGRPRARTPRTVFAVVVAAAGIGVSVAMPCAPAAEPEPAACRCTSVEVFIRKTRADERAFLEQLEAFARDRGGLRILIRDVETETKARERFEKICEAYREPDWQPPLVYTCRRALCGKTATLAAIGKCMTIEVFTRTGCSRCSRAKAWLDETIRPRYPGWEIVINELTTDAAARERVAALAEAHRVAASSVPAFHLCGAFVVGFDSPETTGKTIEDILATWSSPCLPAANDQGSRDRRLFRLVSHAAGEDAAGGADDLPIEPPADLPIAPPPDLPIGPAAAATMPLGPDDPLPPDASVGPKPEDKGITLPVVGHVEERSLGMPLFTVLVGLVDGFNPCAMWVLVFLLSILVNLRDRWRMLAIAGTFVFVSGAAYFAFMAAWLNVFVLIGYLRSVQIILGVLAVGVGAIHVKDFFAFKQGISLSIPESAKPGIYDRVRRIVSADNLPAAIAGAFTLAVLVNIVELLCTAGLPALYTNILTQQGYTAAGRYGYLLLYIAAYMFDDAVMVTAVVATLSRRRLQEQEGRWLKLVSGVAILGLGLVMLVKPEWLG